MSTNINFIEGGSKIDTIAIYCHSLTQSSASEFSKKTIAVLSHELSISVITFDFDFINKQQAPSENLVKEIAELNEVYERITNAYRPKKVIMVGKSIGGIIALGLLTEGHFPNLSTVVILGLPLKLGFPPRINQLNKDGEPDYNYKNEFRNLLAKAKFPVVILQGELDDLGTPKEISESIIGLEQLKIIPIPDAGHSLEPLKDTQNKNETKTNAWSLIFLRALKQYQS